MGESLKGMRFAMNYTLPKMKECPLKRCPKFKLESSQVVFQVPPFFRGTFVNIFQGVDVRENAGTLGMEGPGPLFKLPVGAH